MADGKHHIDRLMRDDVMLRQLNLIAANGGSLVHLECIPPDSTTARRGETLRFDPIWVIVWRARDPEPPTPPEPEPARIVPPEPNLSGFTSATLSTNEHPSTIVVNVAGTTRGEAYAEGYHAGLQAAATYGAS